MLKTNAIKLITPSRQSELDLLNQFKNKQSQDIKGSQAHHEECHVVNHFEQTHKPKIAANHPGSNPRAEPRFRALGRIPLKPTKSYIRTTSLLIFIYTVVVKPVLGTPCLVGFYEHVLAS